MMRFARDAVRKAPAGSSPAGISLHALSELTWRSGPSVLSATPAARARLGEIARPFAEVAPDDERLPALRHLPARFMLRSRMYAAALEQFRLIGPWCGAGPWREGGTPWRPSKARAAPRRSWPAPPPPRERSFTG
ncbi:hypothetical protein OG393_04150 [Streptomyces sp. NBC_01216]|uniref:hypothetical protein n=1 Tax=Streptomyces sp. NBC_01216 TaxID=2903778 RepID=UPI002E0E653C|nr:hypothetical protein OG393_04150 [Streptomyces sp. NBC_01216]